MRWTWIASCVLVGAGLAPAEATPWKSLVGTGPADVTQNTTRNAGPPAAPLGAIPRPPSEGQVVTRYVPSPQVTEAAKRRFVAGLTKRDPKAARQIEAAMRKEDFRAVWAKAVASDGLGPDDVADAMASYRVLNWLTVHGTSDNTAAQTQGTRRQVVAALAANPSFRAMNDAQRQEMAELLMYNFVLQSSAYQGAAARHDATQLRQLADAAEARFLKEDGLDLRNLALTDQGLQPATRNTGAIGGPPAGRAPVAATASPPPSPRR